MAEQYVYAVARIHANESSLLTRQDLEQLLAARNYAEAMKMLADKGFGGGKSFSDYEKLLSFESEASWALIDELFDDLTPFDVLRFPADFHNLKASVKAFCTSIEPENIFVSGGTVEAKDIYEAISKQNYDILPEHLAEIAKTAQSTLLHTRDGQLCDLIVDKALIDAVISAGKRSDSELIRWYSEIYAALADIKIAVRAQKTGKPAEFYDTALAQCPVLDIKMLKDAALCGRSELLAFLHEAGYGGAADALEASASEFEKYCDNLVVEHILPEKYNSFSLGPAVAYLLARQNEIRALRIILSGKLNGLPEESVRERLRNMYV